MKYFYWASGLILAAVLILFLFVPAFAGKLMIPAELTFGNFSIRLYGITMASSILIGYVVARKFSWRFGISATEVDDLAFWLTIIGLVGARLYYVIFDWNFFSADHTEIYKVWHGGLSIYGALIAGFLFIIWYSRKKAYSWLQLLDLVALGLPLAQALGRFGNFFNQEAYGLPTNLPWKMYIAPFNRPVAYRSFSYFHPTFLYEAIASVIIFMILRNRLVGKVRPGVLAFSYLGMYSIVRFFIEGIRLDSSYIYGIKVDQVTAVFGLVVAGIFIFARSKKFIPKIDK